MLCLVGGQGTGKSTFFRYLAIKDEWFTDDMKRIDDKKVYEYLQGHWDRENVRNECSGKCKKY